MSSKYESEEWQKKVESDCEDGEVDKIKEELFHEEGGDIAIKPFLKTTKHWEYTGDLFLVSGQF